MSLETHERRGDMNALMTAVARLETSHEELIRELRGNGQPGFISQTRTAIAALEQQQAASIEVKRVAAATELLRDRSIKRQVGYAGVILVLLEVVHLFWWRH